MGLQSVTTDAIGLEHACLYVTILPVSAQKIEVPGQEIERLFTPLGIIPKVLLHVADQLVVYSHSAQTTSMPSNHALLIR